MYRIPEGRGCSFIVKLHADEIGRAKELLAWAKHAVTESMKAVPDGQLKVDSERTSPFRQMRNGFAFKIALAGDDACPDSSVYGRECLRGRKCPWKHHSLKIVYVAIRTDVVDV
eukprot:CAMPEP_0168419986 /NCGR_PEP_ID=MMETSP0228-20121227/32545_1 /TAXON_ID=133427 /ORGANISM="Protoceratium reticulatum, Strain CCCM 535 (=CCMP 1889)" /LENGTH=113 /DNA_ID=CAMNT_0008433873 /DNA_START=22 /DNA_END=363 /DNA_ORIENTATION=-